MKIVFITSKLNFTKSGGSIEEIDYIIRTLVKLGNEVTVVTAFSSANDMPEKLPYKVIEENIKSKGLLGVQKEVFGLLKKYSNQADFFHIDAHLFMYGAGLYRLLGGGVPIVAFFNQFLTCWPQYVSSLFLQPSEGWLLKIKKSLRWWIERSFGVFLANKLDLCVFVSPTLQKMYEDFGIKMAGRSIVIGDPIDFRKMARESGITENSYSARLKKQGPITLFYSSRMSAGKGFDVLISAFARVKNKDNFKVILGGTGPEANEVRQMVQDLKLEKYIELTGWVTKERLIELYETSDVFIQADWWPAGTSISLLYALAFGLPSILPGGGGLEWNAGASAIYFKYRDLDELASVIEKLGSDYGLREKLSRNCFKRLTEEDMNYELQISKEFKMMQKVLAVTNTHDR